VAELGPDADEEQQGKLKSIIEANDLDEFLNTAMMSNADFTAENSHMVVLDNTAWNAAQKFDSTEIEAPDMTQFQIPRRPHWTPATTAEELDWAEREAFLDWRRGLAE
jgi:large subunit GTPase 1